MLLSLALMLGMIVAGSGGGVGPTTDRLSLRDSTGEDQARNQSAPEQPPLRLFDCQRDNGEGEGDSDGGLERVAITDEPLELHDASRRWIPLVDRRSEIAQRIREGRGARGPPIA
jgi:hypothetical protein